MTMIERVARAIDPRAFLPCWNDRYGGEIRAEAFASARAAIAAMREPTEAMCMKPGFTIQGDFGPDPDLARELWQQMIDAALSESNEG